MTPNEILNRPMPKSPTCVDCNAPATIVDRPMPLCSRCATIVLCPDKDMDLCLGCLMAYDRNEWDRCPNDDCVMNAPDPADACCPLCGNTDWLIQGTGEGLCESCSNERAYFDAEDYYDAEAEDDPTD